jgi:imidazolonepropionase-like amidohydrolase
MPKLDLRDEMRLFSRTHPGVSPLEILQMTTVNAAKALRKAGQIGSLAAGAFADMAALSYGGRIDQAGVAEELLHAGSVREVFISGELVRTPAAS